jgi:hypothetical protein
MNTKNRHGARSGSASALALASAGACCERVAAPVPGQRQCGQSMIEYVLVCAMLAVALGIGMAGQQSVRWQLIDGFQQGYRNFSYAVSLPT